MVETSHLLVVKIRGRICEPCDLLILKQTEFDRLVDDLLLRQMPEMAGQDRAAIGTISQAMMRFLPGETDPLNVLALIDRFRDQVHYERQHWTWVPNDDPAPPTDGTI